MNCTELKAILTGYDCVSFDLFDTLVFRSVRTPLQVFDLVSRLAGPQLAGHRFPKDRVTAEKKARKLAGTREVTIEEIYRELPYPADRARQLMSLEKETEIRCTMVNRPMMDLFIWCLQAGKTVVVITDMYLDRLTITGILKKHGLVCDRLFISSEAGVTKHSGQLFPYVLAELGIAASRLVHLGDNPRSDVEMPARYGIASPGMLPTAMPSVPYLDRQCRGSICDEQVRFLALRGIQGRGGACTPAFRIGFAVLGPFLLDFCLWLHRQKQTQQLDLLAFVAREGYLIHNCYQILFPEEAASTIYVRLNKNLLRKPLLLSTDDLTTAFLKSIPEREAYTWNELARYACGRDAGEDFPAEPVSYSALASGKEKARLTQLLSAGKADMALQAECLQDYVTAAGFRGKRVGLVNNSIQGSGQSMLEEFFREQNYPVSLHGLQLIKSRRCSARLGNRCSSFVSDGGFPASYPSLFNRNALVLEHLLFEPCGTALSFFRDGDSVGVHCEEPRSESLNFPFVAQVQEAAMQFVMDFKTAVPLGSDRLGTAALVEFLLDPLPEDAFLVGSLFDDDADGEKRLVDRQITFRRSDLFRKSVPGVCWQEGWLKSQPLPDVYFRLFRRWLTLSSFLHRI